MEPEVLQKSTKQSHDCERSMLAVETCSCCQCCTEQASLQNLEGVAATFGLPTIICLGARLNEAMSQSVSSKSPLLAMCRLVFAKVTFFRISPERIGSPTLPWKNWELAMVEASSNFTKLSCPHQQLWWIFMRATDW